MLVAFCFLAAALAGIAAANRLIDRLQKGKKK